MSEPKELNYSLTAGAPMVLRLTAIDGKTYDVRMAVTVFGVTDTGQANPDGTPVLEVKANLALNVAEVK